MSKSLSGLTVTILVLVLFLSGSALAQGPGPQHSEATWRAQFWNNPSLDGTPVLERQDTAIDYNWGSGSPDSRVNADGFSARWTRYVYVTPGTYRFTVNSDDGVRLWVDNTLLVNDWSDHAARVATADMWLSAGHHPIKVEYYENTGLAVISLTWVRVTQPGGGWLAEYFNNDSLSGSPVLTRFDPAIDFNWDRNAPAPGVNADTFSARWTQSPALTPGHYRFSVTADDGVRLWVNGHLLIDEWHEWARWYPSLTPGRYEVFVYIPERFTTTARARYWVAHYDGYTLRVVDQSANGDRWVSLGTFRFRGNKADYVSLSDVTNEPRLSRLIAFDAVKWQPR